MRPETREAVLGQRFEGETVWEIGLHNPVPGQSHQNVLAQFDRGRDTFLHSDCDALWLVEHDMWPPEDALSKLAGTLQQAGVVYGAYLLRHGSLVLNTFEYVGEQNIGESLSLYPEKLERVKDQGMIRVSGAGFGCTLIDRPVVEAYPFHKGKGDQWAPDMPFAEDVLRGGVISAARLDVACGHYDRGRWLWPWEAVGEMMKVRVLQTVNVNDGERVIHLTEGEVRDVRPDNVEDWARGGYVQVIETAAREAPAERAVKPKARKRGL